MLYKSINLDGPKGVIAYDLKEPILTSEGMYSTLKVVGIKPDTEGTCKAVHKGNKTVASTILTEGKDEELAAENACNFTDSFKKDVKMEKMNMLFMVVLGLRVLLAKCIAFNMLMSICSYSEVLGK